MQENKIFSFQTNAAQLVNKTTAIVTRGYSEKEGPFVKTLDNALQSFGVQRQQYFGGHLLANMYTRH